MHKHKENHRRIFAHDCLISEKEKVEKLLNLLTFFLDGADGR
jgi:hypothetical protein